MDFSKKYDNPSPEAKATLTSRLLYCWLFPIFKYGYKNSLETKDLYSARECDFSEKWGNILESNWEKELARAKSQDEPPRLVKAISATFLKPYSWFGLELLFQGVCLRLSHPLLLAALIKTFDPSRTKTGYESWLFATGVVLVALVNIIFMHHSVIGQRRLGMRCRLAICSLIYRKLLRLNRASVGNTAAGQVINLLSNDVNRFDLVCDYLHFIWIMPIVTVIATGIMYTSIGYSAFAGILAMVIQAIPLQGYLSSLQGKFRFKIAPCTDNRVQLMNEITSGIQVIKMYAWEKPFEKLVAMTRKIEIDVITKASYIRGFLVGMMVFTERCALFLSVITYVLVGNKLTGEKVFAAAQLFNTIQLYMAIFYPLGISFYAEAKSSVKRIEAFLSQEELANFQMSEKEVESNCGTVNISNGKASWIKNPIIYTLSDIDLNIKPGALCAVVGQVGSGKSSLLQLILRELPLHKGKLDVFGKVSYASQEPWLFVSTIRNNILFDLPYVKERYKKIVQVCALERDFELLPSKDYTLVGEKGTSLSGGQRARINLARAVYREADIYLFDDPLSAVDTHVGKHLFEECLLNYLKNKTRILVTHQVQFLKQADQIVIINNGQIVKTGTFDELVKNELAHIIQENEEEETQVTPNKQRSRIVSVTSYASVTEDGETDEPEETQELMEKGSVSGSLYLSYLREGGGVLILLFFLFIFLIAQVACNASDIWLTRWTNDEEMRNYRESQYRDTLLHGDNNSLELANNGTISDVVKELQIKIENFTATEFSNSTETYEHTSQTTYIYIYTILIILTILLICFRSCLFTNISMNASKGLHNTMFSNVLKATMRFFDTNPSGRILNRFSKDMGIVDEVLPRSILDAMQVFTVMLGILIMIFIVTPWMIIPTSIISVIMYFIKNIYLASAQDIKRLEGITRSPAFSHVTASLFGLPTIRACKAQSLVIKEFDVIQDQHTSAWFLFLATSEAFGFYLDFVSVIFIGIVTFQFIIFDNGTTLGGEVGLAISQSLILTGMIQYGMRQTAEVTSQMISVERIMQYTKLDKEGPFESVPTKKPDRDWPKFGQVIFKDVCLTYVPEDPPVLNNLNFEIQPAEKIGIVGRTGAGKSSLISAIFRLAPIEGIIMIDNVFTTEIGLHDLRNKISIIPQEPVLFSSSIRNNLDPFNKNSDQEIWTALENVELKPFIDNLNKEISEGGSNFSVGQRQLICLARAILRNNKILIMDEATANVDLQTDTLIQKKIRQHFKDCTVLTIAHRLNTVMDSDKILVMEAGRAVEFAHPHILLGNPDGFLTKMVQQTGKMMEHNLREIASMHYENNSRLSTNVNQNNTSNKEI